MSDYYYGYREDDPSDDEFGEYGYDGYQDDYNDYQDDYDGYQDDYDGYQDDYDYYQSEDDAHDDYEDPDDEDDEISREIEELADYLSRLKVGKEYRRFGYFQCSGCPKTWQSANVFCVYKGDGEFEARWGQQCKECKTSVLPHRNEKLKRSSAAEEGTVPQHRDDLCERCKSGKPCRAVN